MLHRWLQIGRPERDPKDPGPDLSPLANLSIASWGMEVSRSAKGSVDFRVLAPDPNSMDRVARVLGLTFPHVSVLGNAPCAAPPAHELKMWRFARACPTSGHHWWPLNIPEQNDRWMTDYQETLVSTLGGPSLGNTEVRIQLLARRVGTWESGLFSSRYEKLTLGLQGQHNTLFNGSWKTTPTPFDLEKLRKVEQRRAKVPIHVEVRGAWKGSDGHDVLAALRPWLAQWTTLNNGGAWRWFDEVRSWPLIAPHRVEGFWKAFADDDPDRYRVKAEARDVSGGEGATMFAPTWRRAHAALTPLAAAPTARHGSAPARFILGPGGKPMPYDYEEDMAFLDEMRKKVGLPPAKRLPPPPVRALPSQEVRPISPEIPCDLPGWVLGSLADVELRLPGDWRHMGIIGGTGTGKSTLELNLVLQAIGDPRPGTVVVLDPTGALIRDIKTRLSLAQARDTVEFDPSQLFFSQKGEEWVAPGFNFLDLPPDVRGSPAAFDRATSVVISDLIRSIHDAFGTESVGARAGYFMTALLKGLMKRPGTTLPDVRDIIVNKDARERYSRWLPPGSVFEGSFAKEELPKYRIEDFVSTLDKTGWFSGSHLLRGALCQRDKPASFPEFLNHRLVLLNVSRGLVGDQNCRILGSAFLSMLWSERLARGEGAPPLTLVIDEAQTFAVPSLSQMLSEGRKYGVRVVLANQYFAQLPESLRAAMEGNLNVWCCFRTGPEDSRAAHKVTQARQWEYAEERFTWLPDHQFVCNILTHSNQGFWQTAPPPPASSEALASEKAIRETLQKEFAARESSEQSPFLVDQETLGPVCFAVSEGTTLREEIAEELDLPKGEVFAALRRAEDLGYVTWASKTKENRITPLGQSFVDAWGARNASESEGELHMDLQARAIDHVQTTWGAEVEIHSQGANAGPVPDGTFVKDGITCNLEVECSTLATKKAQVARNIRKALEDHHRYLGVVRSMEAADRLLDVARELVPEAKLGREFAVLAWGETKFSVIPSGVSSDGFPFVRDDPGRVGAGQEGKPGAPPPSSTVTGLSQRGQRKPDVEVVRDAVESLRAQGKFTATSTEIVESMAETERGRFVSPKTGRITTKLGSVLKRLGITWDKQWDKETGNAVKVYDLRPQPTAPCENLVAAEKETSREGA
ncbi:MAG: TraM recognition domain-containing protein [Euryarchaeota archaeon]|nr:TraM recognition domain-containing protein [Euryarchaeota archaeon]